MTLLAVGRTRERSDSPPHQLPSHGVLPMASTPYAPFTEGK